MSEPSYRALREASLLVSGYRETPDGSRKGFAYMGLASLTALSEHLREQVARACPTCDWRDRYGWFLIGDVLNAVDDTTVHENPYLVVAKHLLAVGGPYTDDFRAPLRTPDSHLVTLGDVRSQLKTSRSYEDDIELRRIFCAHIIDGKSNIFRRIGGHPATAAKALVTALETAIETPGYIAERLPFYQQRLQQELESVPADPDRGSEQRDLENDSSDRIATDGGAEASPIWRHPVVTIVALVATIAAVMALIAFFFWRRNYELVADNGGTTPTATTTPLSTTWPTPSGHQPGPSLVDNACPDPDPTNRKLPQYELCVEFWCQGPVNFPDGSVDHSRVQIKLRPRIVNNSQKPLDISISKPAALRLLVASTDLPSVWRPPKRTADQGDEPYLIKESDGQQYYAVAPNLPHDIDHLNPGAHTDDGEFATFWSATSIDTRQFYPAEIPRDDNGYPIPNSSGQLDQDGDLVFEIPAATPPQGFYGLVLIDREHPNDPPLQTAWFRGDWLTRLDGKLF